MINLGLSAAEQQTLLTLLRSHHHVYITVQVLDLSHTYLDDISDQFIGGQVTIDATQEITRMLNIDLLDPTHESKLDTNSPDDGALFADRQLKILYGVADPLETKWYNIPVFCGPITKMDRNGPVITLECSGKEKLSNSNLWRAHTFKKGSFKTTVIRWILVNLAGENKLDIQTSTAKLPNHLTLTRTNVPWTAAKNLGSTMGLKLWYDARGVSKLASYANQNRFTFTDTETIITEPQIGFDMSTVINAVEVIGAKPKKSKKKVSFTAVAPRSHVLSPWALGRKNASGVLVPRYLVQTITDNSLRTRAACRRRAIAELNQALTEGVEVAFDAFPNPLLEEWDKCTARTKKFSLTFIYKKATIPLLAGEASSIGYLKRVTPNKNRIRRR